MKGPILLLWLCNCGVEGSIPIEAPKMGDVLGRWAIESSVSPVTARCEEGYAVAAGGCSCFDAYIKVSAPISGGWRCDCGTTAYVDAYALCVKGE